MRDVSELILVRLKLILDGFLGTGPDQLRTTWRNVIDIPPVDEGTKLPNLPSGHLLDGKESPRVSTAGHAYGRIPPPPAPYVMTPEIWIVLMPRVDAIKANLELGPELSKWRRFIVGAVTHDDSLCALCGSGGEIEYLGRDTDMQSGGMAEGQQKLGFAITYTLDVDQLS